MEYLGESTLDERKALFYKNELNVEPFKWDAKWIVPIGVTLALMVGVLIRKAGKSGISK